jgi:hypothetical protein
MNNKYCCDVRVKSLGRGGWFRERWSIDVVPSDLCQHFHRHSSRGER